VGRSDPGHGFIEGTVIPAVDDDSEIFRAVMRRELQLDPVAARGSMPTRDRVLELIARASLPSSGEK
jgi:hypothetical protein